MSSVLVTGANGFVGRVVVRRFRDAGYAVRCAVRSRESASQLTTCSDMVIVGNVGPETHWTHALNDVEVVVHLAARVHAGQEGEGDPPALYHWVNFRGTERLGRCAADAGVKRLLYVSSVKAAAGATHGTPLRPNMAPAPEGPYGRSKLAAEEALWSIAANRDLEVAVVRPPLVYGPGVGANFLRLMQAIRSGVPLPLKGIHNRRSLVFVENLADALVTLADSPGASGSTVYVSDGAPVSTPVLVRLLANAMERPPRLVTVPPWLLRLARPIAGSAIDRLISDLEVSSEEVRELGWTPPWTTEEGIRRTVKWFLSEPA